MKIVIYNGEVPILKNSLKNYLTKKKHVRNYSKSYNVRKQVLSRGSMVKFLKKNLTTKSHINEKKNLSVFKYQKNQDTCAIKVN